MPTVTIEEAQANLADLIEKLAPGEEVVITRNAQPVARLVSPKSAQCDREKAAAALRAAMGKWPGDETDEEIRQALEELS